MLSLSTARSAIFQKLVEDIKFFNFLVCMVMHNHSSLGESVFLSSKKENNVLR